MSAHPKKNWLKEQIVANHALRMACQHGLKVVAFTAIGVNLIEYSHELIGLVLGAATGTLLGLKILKGSATIVLEFYLTRSHRSGGKDDLRESANNSLRIMR